MSFLAKKKDDEEIGEHNVAWKETRDPNPIDRQLRVAGATVFSRPRTGKPRWRLNGIVYAQEELERMLKIH